VTLSPPSMHVYVTPAEFNRLAQLSLSLEADSMLRSVPTSSIIEEMVALLENAFRTNGGVFAAELARQGHPTELKVIARTVGGIEWQTNLKPAP
jgi:hypothetical protein